MQRLINQWMLLAFAALLFTVAACKDKNMECQLKCGEEFDKGKSQCGEQDADCWAPFHAQYKTCTDACDAQHPR